MKKEEKDYVKQVKGMGEDAKVALRNAREDARNQVKKQNFQKTKKTCTTKRIRELITKYNKLVDEKVKKKKLN